MSKCPICHETLPGTMRKVSEYEHRYFPERYHAPKEPDDPYELGREMGRRVAKELRLGRKHGKAR